MIGCGRCRRCLAGRHHLCANREEMGVRDGRPGALAEYVAVPSRSVHRVPASLDPALGAMVEPGGNACRAAEAALAGGATQRVLIMGPGTIGLLVAMFVRAAGGEPHLLGLNHQSLDFARQIGFHQSWTADDLPDVAYDAVVDASNAPSLPARALELVEPGGRVVYIGLAGEPSLVDTRQLALADITAVGILGASPGIAATIERYANGSVDPRALVAATVGLDQAGEVLAGGRPVAAGAGPKFHIDPRR